MATTKGSAGVVKVGSNTIAEVTDFSFEENSSEIETTALGDSARSFVSDLIGWSGTINCFWDPSETKGPQAMSTGASISLALYPQGADSSDNYASGTAIFQGISRSNGIGSIVTASFSFKGSGGLTWSTV